MIKTDLNRDYWKIDKTIGDDEGVGDDANPLRTMRGLFRRLEDYVFTHNVKIKVVGDIALDDFPVCNAGTTGLNYIGVESTRTVIYTGKFTNVIPKNAALNTACIVEDINVPKWKDIGWDEECVIVRLRNGIPYAQTHGLKDLGNGQLRTNVWSGLTGDVNVNFYGNASIPDPIIGEDYQILRLPSAPGIAFRGTGNFRFEGFRVVSDEKVVRITAGEGAYTEIRGCSINGNTFVGSGQEIGLHGTNILAVNTSLGAETTNLYACCLTGQTTPALFRLRSAGKLTVDYGCTIQNGCIRNDGGTVSVLSEVGAFDSHSYAAFYQTELGLKMRLLGNIYGTGSDYVVRINRASNVQYASSANLTALANYCQVYMNGHSKNFSDLPIVPQPFGESFVKEI